VTTPLQAQISDLEKQLKGQADAKVAADQKAAQLEQVRSATAAERDNLLLKKRELEETIQSLQEKMKKLEAGIPEQISQAKAPFEQQLASLEKELDGRKNDLEGKETTLASVYKERDLLNQERESLLKTKEELSKNLASLQAQNKEYASKITEKEAAVKDLDGRLKGVLDEFEQLERSSAAQAKDKQALADRLAAKDKELPQRMA
jgi:chromosome segregation ATPase